MDQKSRPPQPLAGAGLELIPIHSYNAVTPLRICVVVSQREAVSTGSAGLILLRELPGSRIYLGAICDVDARIQQWVEVWVQTLELRDVAFSGYQERLTNHAFDQRWQTEYQLSRDRSAETVIVTGMEEANPRPIVIKRPSGAKPSAFVPTQETPWRLCKDDALLESFGLPRYSTSPFRYLYDPEADGAKTFLATAEDAPNNSHVQNLERLQPPAEGTSIFNPHAGLIRVVRLNPLALEEYLQVLEGRQWAGVGPAGTRLFHPGIYSELQGWSASQKGLPFLLHGSASPADRLNEVFFLKLSALRSIFSEVRAYVKSQQLPLLNLSPSSFTVTLQEVGEQFPALWTARCMLVKPGQAYPLKIKLTDQKYFIRLGRLEPSSFLPEGLGAHSFGIGSVRLRNVLNETDGTVLEGTLVAEDYLSLDPHDLLWFKLPLGEERLEFYAHVHSAEAVGPREARFRTVPAKLAESIVGKLKPAAGTTFAKAPYEVWPLLSSPCDLYSLGILAIRILLANTKTNLPVMIDDILGLARHLGKDAREQSDLLPKLKGIIAGERKLADLVSPHALIERDWKPEEARSQIHTEIWLESMSFLLRLFPGAGSYSYCKTFGDVSPLALETVFDAPIQELEALLLRLRSALAPSLNATEEIANVVRDILAGI
jgi:hypothetical protein